MDCHNKHDNQAGDEQPMTVGQDGNKQAVGLCARWLHAVMVVMVIVVINYLVHSHGQLESRSYQARCTPIFPLGLFFARLLLQLLHTPQLYPQLANNYCQQLLPTTITTKPHIHYLWV